MTMTALLLAAAIEASGPLQGAQYEVARLAEAANGEISVAAVSLDGNASLSIDADKVYHAASTMKVPVMIELFRQAQSRQLSLDDAVMVRNQFRSIVDGSPYALDPGDDSDDATYLKVGTRVSLRELCESMITLSSNLATNVLIERLGIGSIRDGVERLDAGGMQVVRGLEDGKAFAAGRVNSTSARGLAQLLLALGRHRAVSEAADTEMLAMLARQRWNDAIPAGLPAGTPVAHKTGWITRIHHDAAIVYGMRPFVLVILTRGIDDDRKSAALMAEVAKVVYQRLEAP